MYSKKSPIHTKPVATELVGTNPQLVLVGMCPGVEEARGMRPFIGRSGRLLRKILSQISIVSYYVTNVVKIPYYQSPPNDIIEEWTPICRNEVLNLNLPTVLLGNVAANTFLPTEPMNKRRGLVSYYKNIPMVATWHPSYALRPTNPHAARDIQSDIEKLLSLVGS